MGFLAPLYVAGLLAISLPIIFHLLRRSPHGKQIFSSLMFLVQSPPRLTRRSRLTNILLLILRALALTLLAFAFARPFIEWGSNLDKYQASGRRIAILIDTSGSMQRGDLWKQATNQADEVLRTISPNDEVALYLFDGQVHPALSFDEWNQTALANRVTVLRARLAEVKPGWAPTRSGDALATVADFVAEAPSTAPAANGKDSTPRPDERLRREIVLISDIQQGGRPEALQGHQWPANVLLEVKPVILKPAGNASVQWVEQAVQADDMGKADERLRVRISNEADSTHEQFTLTWWNELGPVKFTPAPTTGPGVGTAASGIEPLKVYVAPGRSQIVRIDWPGEEIKPPPDRLVLTGDDCDFDNTLFIAPRRVERVRVVYLGDDGPQDVQGLRYYLQSALADTRERKLEWIAHRAGEPLTDADLVGVRLVVVAGPLAQDSAERLRRYMDSGGGILCILKDQATVPTAGQLLATAALTAREATGNYALLGRVDVKHPLFAPFADARFGDFTKIHFWKHRSVQLPARAGAGDIRILASFDNGDPFLFEKTIGKGWLRVVTSGWQPADSQLALSTKFVPLMEGMIQQRGETLVSGQYAVGEPIAMPPPPHPPTSSAQAEAGSENRSITTPKGQRIELSSTATSFNGADTPGIYRLIGGTSPAGAELQDVTLLAVNLSPEESRTTPMPVEELERWAPGWKRTPGTAKTQPRRRLRVSEG